MPFPPEIPQQWGSSGDDILDGRADEGREKIFGEAGDDLIRGGAGFNIINPGDGADHIVIEGNAQNVIYYWQPDDLIDLSKFSGLSYNDLSFHTEGRDEVISTAQHQFQIKLIGRAWYKPGPDKFIFEHNRTATEENDHLIGSPLDDSFVAGGGHDLVQSFGGNDRVDGGHGDDILEGGKGDDQLIGRTGDDTLRGGAGVDGLEGGAGDDLLEGGSGKDQLWGGTGDDRLVGGAGEDILIGDGPEDMLAGLLSQDYSGTGGDDTFVFKPSDNGVDYVYGFGHGNDRIDLSAYDSASVSFSQVLGGHTVLEVGNSTIYLMYFDLSDFDASQHIVYSDADGM